MANQNFRVKNGLEVGTGVTISGGIVTATTFSGNATSSNYATTAGITTYSSISGISTSVIGGIGNISQLQVSGVSTFQSSVFLGDGDVLYFGDGEDLLIWHNSNDSIIRDSGTGDLLIEGGNRIKLTNPTGIETYAVFNQDGAVELYYDNVKKFETISAGILIDGSIGIGTTNPTANLHVVGSGTTALLVNGNARITGILTIGTSSITFDGVNDRISLGTQTIISSSDVSSFNNGLNVSGVSTFAGITTVTGSTLFAKQLNVSGIVTATTFEGSLSGSLSGGVLTNYAETLYSFGNTGATPTFSLSNGNFITATLDVNITSMTFSMSGVPSGAFSFTLFLRNDATPGRTITWPPSVRWSNGSVPVRTTTANQADAYTFFTTDGGSVWYGNLSLYNYA